MLVFTYTRMFMVLIVVLEKPSNEQQPQPYERHLALQESSRSPGDPSCHVLFTPV